jgi:hypothetical protein
MKDKSIASVAGPAPSRGREVGTQGDGFLATFDPECAMRAAIIGSTRLLGIELGIALEKRGIELLFEGPQGVDVRYHGLKNDLRSNSGTSR